MNKQMYSLKMLSDELGQSRQNITRRLEKLTIKAVNEDSRTYKTEPLLYNIETFLVLSKEFGVEVSASEDISKEEVSASNEELMIKQIEELKADKHRLEIKLDKSEDRHEKQLSEANELTKRQQELNMKDKLKIEYLESKLKITQVNDPIQDVKVDMEEKTTNKNQTKKWYEFWR